MADQEQVDQEEIRTLTSQIVGAYVAHHTVALGDLPALIATVGQELIGLGQGANETEEERPDPAVPIKR